MKRQYRLEDFLIEMSASEAEQILGLSGSYSAAQVKSSYKKMSLKHHPDKGGSTEMMKKVNAAYFENRLYSDSVRWKEMEFIKVDPKELIPEDSIKTFYLWYKNR